MKYSTSALNTSFRCAQLFDYTYNHKLEPIDSGSFEASYGRAFHSLVEGDLESFQAAFGDKWQAIIQAHYDGYCAYWANREPLNYHAHEIKFSFTLADKYRLHGIVDGVAEYKGENYLVESKTTGQSFPDFIQYKLHVYQPAVYLLAALHSPELQHYNIKGLIYDVTKRPSIRQKKTESDKDYLARVNDWLYDNREDAFNRQVITRDDDYLADAAADIMMQIDLLSTGKYPKNRDACFAYRQKCGFYETCFGKEKLTNTELYKPRSRR